MGEPIAVTDILHAADLGFWSEQRLDRALANRIGEALTSLKVTAPLQRRRPCVPNIKVR